MVNFKTSKFHTDNVIRVVFVVGFCGSSRNFRAHESVTLHECLQCGAQKFKFLLQFTVIVTTKKNKNKPYARCVRAKTPHKNRPPKRLTDIFG